MKSEQNTIIKSGYSELWSRVYKLGPNGHVQPTRYTHDVNKIDIQTLLYLIYKGLSGRSKLWVSYSGCQFIFCGLFLTPLVSHAKNSRMVGLLMNDEC